MKIPLPALLLIALLTLIGAAHAADNTLEPPMVRIPGMNYEIGKYHVTRDEFAVFISQTGYDAGDKCWKSEGGKWAERSGRNWRNPGFTQNGKHPVTCVNWNDAQAYVSWLSKKTGRQYRLPNEAEWLYACYGGSRNEYCGGSDMNALAWHKNNSGGHTHPVGQKQVNGFGLYDMSGNLWQWMEDNEYDSRVVRGSSWRDFPQKLTDVAFEREFPERRDDYHGFRLARTLPTGSVQQFTNKATQQPDVPKGFISHGGLTWMPVMLTKKWNEANSYCANTAINGQSGWRLPTKDELVALYDSGAMNSQGWTLNSTWSSTPDGSGGHYYFLVGGHVITNDDTNLGYVPCVR